MNRAPSALVLLLGGIAVGLLASPSTAQPIPDPAIGWVPLLQQTQPMRHPMCGFDPSTGRGFVYEINNYARPEIYQWNGAEWIGSPAASRPTGRRAPALAFDSHRGRAVMFGGFAPHILQMDTWEWDGRDWQRLSLPRSPAARRSHSMVFDEARGEVLLFGGLGGQNTALGDTWVFDGITWTERTPQQFPAPRSDAALAFDSARGRVVMFGGLTATGTLADTWEWDGSDWIERSPAHAPSRRFLAGMTFDSTRQRTVLLGGLAGSGPLPMDVWEWDGVDWSARPSVAGPSARSGHATFYDPIRGRVVVHGGTTDPVGSPTFGDTAESDTWTWDPATGNWQRRTPLMPPLRNGPAMVTDTARGRCVLFGGFGVSNSNSNQLAVDTWVWDGAQWAELHTPHPAPTMFDLPAVYDAARDQVVVWIPGEPASTWLFDGTDWQRATPAHSPDSRSAFALAYDPLRAETVLYGGAAFGAGALAETWVWNGVDWQQRAPIHSPGPRSGCALGWDPALGELLLYGGSDGSSPVFQTWTWNGVDWTERQPVHDPGWMASPRLVEDPGRGALVLVGQALGVPDYRSLWEWDGVDWAPLDAPSLPPVPQAFAVAVDPVRARPIQFGGASSAGGYSPNTLILSDTPAGTTTYGAGCAGTAGSPQLLPSGRPALGTPFQLELVDVPALAPAAVLCCLAAGTGSLGPCRLLVDPVTEIVTLHFAADAHGLGIMPLDVPNAPALAGATMFCQAAAMDTGVPLGVVLSGAVRITLGD